jgi:hypothetical protein
MASLTQVLRSLGNAGAVANVQANLDQRHREAWLVDGLISRLALREAATGAAVDPMAGPAARVA